MRRECSLLMSNHRSSSHIMATASPLPLVLVSVLSIAASYLYFSSKSAAMSPIQSISAPNIIIKAERVTLEGKQEPMTSVTAPLISNPNLRSATTAMVKKNYAPELPLYPSLCKVKRLFGREHNGGWFVCGDDLPDSTKGDKCVIYSYGLGADWSFDSAAEKEAGCEVHGFDPSGLLWRQGMHGRDYSGIDYATQYPSKLKTFHNWGIGVVEKALYPVGTVPQEWPGLGDPQLSKSNSEPWLLKSIEQTMIELGHAYSGLTVLKVDTEGSEWDAMTAFFNSEKVTKMIKGGKIRQLLLEWHWDPDSTARNQRHEALMRKVEELGFRPWYVNRHEGSECCLDVSYVWRPDSSAATGGAI